MPILTLALSLKLYNIKSNPDPKVKSGQEHADILPSPSCQWGGNLNCWKVIAQQNNVIFKVFLFVKVQVINMVILVLMEWN